LFSYHILAYTDTHTLRTFAGAFVMLFALVYFIGILGTFAHHRLAKEKKIKEVSL